MNELTLFEDGSQLVLPEIGDQPVVMTFPPLAMAQLILYRSDLLEGSLIEPVRSSHTGECKFVITAPNGDASRRIVKYLRGELK